MVRSLTARPPGPGVGVSPGMMVAEAKFTIEADESGNCLPVLGAASKPGPAPGPGLVVVLVMVSVSLSGTVRLHPGQAGTLRSVLAGLIMHSVPLVTAVDQLIGKLKIILSYDLRCQSSHCGGRLLFVLTSACIINT